ncbi:MAG TPA: acyltransferase [Bacteroidia bacterium]|nr:acyltransferase [Bacteroidia bacterium]
MQAFHLPRQVNILKTLFLRAKYVTNNTGYRNLFGILIFKKIRFEVESSSRIILNKSRLEIGVSWARNSPFSGFLKMSENACMSVNGSFRIFDRCVIYINKNATLELGNNSFINSNSNIHCFKRIKIGSNTVISEGVTIRDSDNHSMDYPDYTKTADVEIGNNVWIGINVTILKGVKIGDGAVIAAGALVNKDIPGNSLAGGVPAKVKKTSINWIR